MLENNLIESPSPAGFTSESFVTKGSGRESEIRSIVDKTTEDIVSKPDMAFAEILEHVETNRENPLHVGLVKNLVSTVQSTDPDVLLEKLDELDFVALQPTLVAPIASDVLPTNFATASMADALPTADEPSLESILASEDPVPVEVPDDIQSSSSGNAPLESTGDMVLTVTTAGVSEHVAVPQANIATLAVESEVALRQASEPADLMIQQEVHFPAAAAQQAIGATQVVQPNAGVRSNRAGQAAETESKTVDSIPETVVGVTEQAPPTVEFASAEDQAIQLPVESEFEPVVSETDTPLNRQQSTPSTTVSQHDVFVTEPPARLVSETWARTDSTNRPTQDPGRLTTQRVSETIIREVQIEGNNGSKQMTLHLHPEQLGKLTLQVGWESESIVARIVASEQATSDMLNRDKSWLMDTMQDNGFKFDSFDVSYGGAEYEQDLHQNSDASSFRERGPDPENAETKTILINEGQGSVINIIA